MSTDYGTDVANPLGFDSARAFDSDIAGVLDWTEDLNDFWNSRNIPGYRQARNEARPARESDNQTLGRSKNMQGLASTNSKTISTAIVELTICAPDFAMRLPSLRLGSIKTPVGLSILTPANGLGSERDDLTRTLAATISLQSIRTLIKRDGSDRWPCSQPRTTVTAGLSL